MLARPLNNSMRPKEVVETWVAAFNAGDVDRLVSLYAPDAVNHQVAEEPVEGRQALRAMFEREFAATDGVPV